MKLCYQISELSNVAGRKRDDRLLQILLNLRRRVSQSKESYKVLSDHNQLGKYMSSTRNNLLSLWL